MNAVPERPVEASTPTVRPRTKRARVLQALVDGHRLTRFDAEQIGDHCLPSTVSGLQKLGVNIRRELIQLEGRFGRFNCCEYWIDCADLDDARRVLNWGGV